MNLSEFSAIGGRSKSDQKTAAARANGAKGGRPRKDGSRARSVRPLPGFTPLGALSLTMLREVARDLPGTTDAWRLAEAGRLLAQASDELERLRK